MHVVPYLNFDGDCAEAFAFYADLLGGRIEETHRFSEGPPEACATIPEHWRDKVMHARMTAGKLELLGCDAPPQFRQEPQGFRVALQVDSLDEGRRAFDALAAGGQVAMRFEKTFWSPGFGMVTDRYGTPWMVNVIPA